METKLALSKMVEEEPGGQNGSRGSTMHSIRTFVI